MVASPLIHIGYHKTGSTWLQRGLFASVAAGFCLPWDRRREVRSELVLVNPFEFDAGRTAPHFAAGLDEAAAHGLVPVLSNERLSGSPFAGGGDAKAIAERLAGVFPQGRVLIVIREQRSMIESTYRQYVKVGGAESPARFLQPPERGPSRVPLFSPRHFEYDLLIGGYQDLFGRDRVLVLPLELLVADAVAFARSIHEFAGASGVAAIDAEARNRGLTAIELEVKRRLNRVLVRDTLNPTALVDRYDMNDRVLGWSRRLARRMPAALETRAEARLRAVVDDAVEGRFEASNRRTTALTGLDLKRYGYRLAPA